MGFANLLWCGVCAKGFHFGSLFFLILTLVQVIGSGTDAFS